MWKAERKEEKEEKIMGGVGFIVFGVLLSLYGFGKIQASKNPEKNAEWLSKYGKFLRIAGPCLVVIGILTLLMSKFVNV